MNNLKSHAAPQNPPPPPPQKKNKKKEEKDTFKDGYFHMHKAFIALSLKAERICGISSKEKGVTSKQSYKESSCLLSRGLEKAQHSNLGGG